MIFSISSMPTVLITRTYIVPSIPSNIGTLPKDIFIMLLFAILMITSAIFMLKPKNINKSKQPTLDLFQVLKLIAGSIGVGLLTGMVGAGGGFLIIPTLISLFGLSTKEAIGTSLTIISINSIFGFKGDLSTGIYIDLALLSIFISLTLIGILIGIYLGKNIEGARLKNFLLYLHYY